MRCDFCDVELDPTTCHEIKARSFFARGGLSSGSWMACPPCWDLFDRKDWNGLEERWLANSPSMRRIRKAWVIQTARYEVRLLWQQLRENLV